MYAEYYTHTAIKNYADEAAARYRLRSRLPWHASDPCGKVGYLRHRRPGRVLDVGCGTGERLRRMRAAGWSTAGVDFDPQAVAIAKQFVDGTVKVGTVHHLHETASFDAVVMFHTLEHIDDPLATLVRTRELLTPGGVLSIATPNAESWLHGIYASRWRGLEPPRHLQVFSHLGLRRILLCAGFEHANIFTTARNAGALALASEEPHRRSSSLSRLALSIKAELLQAMEWARLKRSPYCGEELVAIAASGS